MSLRKRTHLMLLAAALLVITTFGAAQQPVATPASSLSLTDAMPVDAQITRGQLPNGLRYYVRANKKPEKRAELRLAVKTGSVLEDDDQQGLAHFVEHMAFNGTRNFPKQEVVSFLESLGMRFGADINAYTSFDETVFMLQVPTDKPATMERALSILEDWAHNVTFDPVEIDKERGVVMEEWRLRRGAGARMTDRIFPILLKGSRYADQLPIGKTDIIQNFKAERLTGFYSDWYRPDLMAIVAVGDFDPAAIEGLIKERFAAISAAATPRPRPLYEVPDHPGTVYAVTIDKEMTATSVEVDYLLPARQQGSVGVYRQKIVDRLFASMLSARFSDLAQKPEAPFLSAFAGRGIFLARTKENASLRALVKDGGSERGLEGLLDEAERVVRFGFTATELDRQKLTTMRARERMVAEKDNRESFSRADEYVRNFLQEETLPAAELEFALHQRFVPQITLDEVNALAKTWFPGGNRLVVVSAPDKPGIAAPEETKLAAVVAAAATRTLTPYVDAAATAVLLESAPAPGRIARTATNDAAGITEWELSNGVKVVLKPTTFKQDEILFSARSPGGTSLASDADFIPASTAARVVNAGGVGKLNVVDLGKVMSGKIALATSFVGELEEGLNGSASTKDLETMFQLIYLRFTAPRPDPTAFTVQATMARTQLANLPAIPEYAFVETLTSTMTQDHPRRKLATAATVDQWNLDKSLAFYKDRFADASDFTFVFVGSFDVAAMRPLVERYLGALPSTRRKETWKDVGVRLPTGVIAKTVEKGIEPKSQAAIVFSGPFQYDQTQRVAVRAMSEVLQTRLLELIREELGGTYSIRASYSYQKNPRPEYQIAIQFGCDPLRTEDLVKRVLDEVEQFKANGPTDKQVTDEREALLREFETNTKLNTYLHGQITLKYQYGEDPAGLWNIPDYYRKLDAAGIQLAAKTYLNPANRVRVTLFPAKKQH